MENYNPLRTMANILQTATSMLMLSILVSPANASQLTSSDGLHPDGFSLPGLVPAGYPNFETDVTVNWHQTGKSGYILHAYKSHGGSNLLNMTPDFGYDVFDSSYQLRARFDAAGDVVFGSIKITGSIAEMNVFDSVLMTATLGDFAYDDNLIGFNTHNIDCPWFDFCTENESVYIELADSFSMDLKRLHTTGLAVTTIPLPAGVWLFGSGLVALAGFARRKKP